MDSRVLEQLWEEYKRAFVHMNSENGIALKKFERAKELLAQRRHTWLQGEDGDWGVKERKE